VIGNELGPYRVLQELGTGGMGSVYKAELCGPVADLPAGSIVALKVLHPHMVAAEGVFERFQREAQVGMRIVHDNVVRTFDVGQCEDASGTVHYLAMEFVEGQTLRELLDELGTIPEQLCRHIGVEVVRGLVELHRNNVIHRDLKPENVLITKDEVVKVMDLGVARLAEEAIKLSQTGQFIGSLVYAAPEQFMGGKDIDGRADLYSLGLVLYELSTSQNPFDAEDIGAIIERKLREEAPDVPAVLRPAAEVNPQLSPYFEQVTRALVRKECDERIACAEDLLAILVDGEDSAWWRERARAIRSETRRPLRRIRIPRETALYGRDKEIAQIHRLFESAAAGDGKALLLEGEAGIGKTRLIDEFVGQIEQGGMEVNFLFGGYPPSGAATADGAFSTAYREHFDSSGLEDSLGGYLRDTPLLVPALAALLRGEPTPDGAEPLTRSSMQTVFVHLTAALASEKPTIVVIDDLHFAPEEGRALFAALAMAAPGKRLLLIGSTRPGMDEEWTLGLTQQSHVDRMALPRLGREELVSLLNDSFGSPNLAEQLADRIGTKSDGNPFFIFELIRDLREGNLIEAVGSGTWVSTRVLRDLRVPSTVMDLIAARMSGLSEEDREILDVAACCGHEFDPGLVAEAVGIRRIPFLRTLGRIERERKLIRSVGRKYVFDHHQVQEVIYSGLPEPLRCEYHAVIAETMEEREEAADLEPAELEGNVAIQLAEHFVKGARVKEGSSGDLPRRTCRRSAEGRARRRTRDPRCRTRDDAAEAEPGARRARPARRRDHGSRRGAEDHRGTRRCGAALERVAQHRLADDPRGATGQGGRDAARSAAARQRIG